MRAMAAAENSGIEQPTYHALCSLCDGNLVVCVMCMPIYGLVMKLGGELCICVYGFCLTRLVIYIHF